MSDGLYSAKAYYICKLECIGQEHMDVALVGGRKG